MSIRLRSALVVALALVVTGCATNTITGRSQFVLVSEQQAISGSTSAYANMVGQYAKKGKVLRDARAERIREMTNRLVAEAVRFRPDAAGWAWQVTVIDDPKTVNAFCMAGGKMGIYSGMWEKLGATDDEIANVMGHEIGHALASHTREKMSVAMSTSIGTSILAAMVASRDPGAFQQTRDGFDSVAALAINLPNSREAENEADQIGIELAARAGYDPRAAVTLWQKMARLGGGGRSEFTSTHPSPQNRIQRLNELVAKVDPYYRQAQLRGAAEVPDFLGNVNERRPGAPSRDDYARRVAAEPQTMTFVADAFDRFRQGGTVLSCGAECGLAYTLQKGAWKRFYETAAWRDLAVAVVKVNYGNDLAYFLLGTAADGLGLPEAAKRYYAAATDAQRNGRSCAGTLLNTCEGLDVAALVRERALRDARAP